MPKGRSKALLFIPYRSSARSGLGLFFKLENAQTFRSEALLEPVLESHQLHLPGHLPHNNPQLTDSSNETARIKIQD